MKKPSLALIPSGYKAGKVYSILPNNGVGDFTFTRNSVATRVNKDGLIEDVAIDVPRLDYSDAGCPSLLLEPSRTNIVTHSEDFSNASWTKTNVDIETADIVSPSGELDATKMTINSASQPRRIFDVLSTTIELDYTFSLYVKKGNTDLIFALTSSGSLNATFNLTTLSATNGSIEDAGNGWYRIIATFNALSVTEVIQIVLGNTDSVGSFQYIYGAQIEQGSNATSYIPTNGATATRIGELCVDSMLDSPIITSDDWTLFFDLDCSEVDNNNRRISLVGATLNDKIELNYNASSTRFSFVTRNGGVSINYAQIITTERAKIALVSTADGYDLYHNGNFISSQTQGRFDASTMRRISFDQGITNSLPFEGKVYGLRYYDEAITSQEAITLTTL